ncbi:hypothetical protein [Rhodopseudomonas sp. B29]|uniref:hypothetical protein n=1 Tax=Rhodopseudomonas sp. B29 TaxID=95607 RepID=UPI000592993D
MLDVRLIAAGTALLMSASLAVPAAACSDVHASAAPSVHLAQATPQPLQSTPGAENKPSAPPETTGQGPRPHDIPPQPARPDAAAVDAGAKPALPPAPPEKMGEPVQPKGG